MSILEWLFGRVHPPAKLEVPPDSAPSWAHLLRPLELPRRCCDYHKRLTDQPFVEPGPGTLIEWCGKDPLDLRFAFPQHVRSIAWREDWGCWMAKRDRSELMLTLISNRPPHEMQPSQLAQWAALEFSEKRPEPWMDAAVAALKEVTP